MALLRTDLLFVLKPLSPLLARVRVGLKPPSPLRGRNGCLFVRFSVAEVLSVSTVAVHGRAMVMVVSRWPAVAVAEVAVVAPSPRGCTLCAKEFAQRTKNGPK